MSLFENRPNAALIVIDVQNGVVAHAHERDAVVANVSSLVDKARLERVPVIWVRHSDEGLKTGSEDWRIVPELTPRDAEPLIDKRYGDCFEDTNLEACADRCVHPFHTARRVRARLRRDACQRRPYDPGSDFMGAPPPGQVIAHTNLYWSFQTAPGRTAGSKATKDVDFGGTP